MNHTPTPLGIFKRLTKGFMQFEIWAITGPKHSEECWDIIADDISSEERALEIVTACNCHEELVGVLEKLKKELGPDGEYAIHRADGESMFIGEVIAIGNIFEQADELLAKAKGEQK